MVWKGGLEIPKQHTPFPFRGSQESKAPRPQTTSWGISLSFRGFEPSYLMEAWWMMMILEIAPNADRFCFGGGNSSIFFMFMPILGGSRSFLFWWWQLKYFVHVHAYTWGKWSNLTSILLKRVGSTTNYCSLKLELRDPYLGCAYRDEQMNHKVQNQPAINGLKNR